MFRKFTTILNQAVEALAPSTPLQEDFIYHWKAITNYFLDNKDEKRPIEQTNIPEHLAQMVNILVEEEHSGETGSTGPCMEYMLHHKLLDTLYTLGRTDCPPGMKQQVLVFFTQLLSKISQPLLPHVNVHKSVQRFIKVCGEVKAAPTEAEEIQFLLTVCSKLRQDPYLVNFFLDGAKSRQQVNQPNQKTQSTAKDDRRFVLLESLLSLCHSADGRVGVKACEGLMLCASLPEDSCADAILNRTAFCKEITNWLNMAYDRLPKMMDPSDIEGVDAKWGLDVVTAREDRTSFPGRRQLVSFISLLDYCDQLIHVSHPHVGTSLSRSIRDNFLVPVVQPCLLHAAEGVAITATAHLIRCLRVISSTALVHEFETFILGEGTEAETPGAEDQHLRRKILDRCNHLSEELSTITLKLFDTLLQVPSERVIHNLILRNLESRSYYDHSNEDSSNLAEPSPRQKLLHRTTSHGDGPVTVSETNLESVSGNGGQEQSDTIDWTCVSDESKEWSSNLSENIGNRNTDVCENSTDIEDQSENSITQSDSANVGTGDINVMDSLVNGVDGGVMQSHHAGALIGEHGADGQSGDCDLNSGVDQRTSHSPRGSEPPSPGFERELGIASPLSPRNSVKPSVHKVVNYFLNLVPEDAKSSYQMADSGYDTYLRDAHRQFSEISSYCRPWNWPKEASEECGQTKPFYEGDFLKMLFDKLSHLLDQNYLVNLQVTSVIAKLALLPHPIIHEYLLNPFVPLHSDSRSLFTVFEKLERDLTQRLKGDPKMNIRLVTVRKQLMGVLKDQRSQSSHFRRVPNKDRKRPSEHVIGFEDSHTLEGVIVLEEFCKELAAIAFVKHHAIDSL